MINLSVDTKDAMPDYVPEDLNVNDQESLVELVLEKCIGLDNAIEEHDEPDEDDGGALDFKKMNIITHSFESFILNRPAEKSFTHSDHRIYFKNYSPEIVPPPPKV